MATRGGAVGSRRSLNANRRCAVTGGHMTRERLAVAWGRVDRRDGVGALSRQIESQRAPGRGASIDGLDLE
jgi:hypothetical protein